VAEGAAAPFLLEVGFEEMPAAWLPALANDFRERFAAAAAREWLDPASVETYHTPRRIVLRASVLVRQPDRDENVWGPSLKVARDATGKWTGAAQGFAKKNGVAPEALGERVKDPAKPDDRYLLFVKKTTGRPAGEVLPGIIAAVLRGLSFPKRMSWDAWLDDGKGAFPFGRPIRWLVALLDTTVVPFVIYELTDGAKGKARVASGPATLGHRFLPRGGAGKPITVRSFDDLRAGLEKHFVVLYPAERARRIDAGLRAAAGKTGVTADHGLAAEWRDLVEYPTVVAGDVPAEFRTLPTEVLETVLVHHQKYVPLAGDDGAVTRFAAVINTDGAEAKEIVRGMERVVVARLRDAAFFFQEDRKRALADKTDALNGVTFHQGLGTYKDKADRIVALVEGMGGALGLLDDARKAAAAQAARLAKADLTTLMVREFPELQGTMGGIYLAGEGVAAEIAKAVRWHYHPLSIDEDASPARAFAGEDARVFAAVSLADKLDTLAGYFGLGLNPTGSSDPFGLRRAAQGAIRVVLDFWPATPRPSLSRLADAAVAGYGGRLKRDAAGVGRDLHAFLLERAEYVLGSRGYPPAEVAAVLHTPGVDALDDLYDSSLRLKALHLVRAESPDDFEHLATAFKRAKNILTQQTAASAIDAKLFDSAAEQGLGEAVARLAGTNGSYEARLRALASLRAPVDRFFDDVLVMAEDPKVRANRLALLNETLSLFYRIADISKLGG
jgi:glycyl-tRNA synthetase beta chain